MTYSAEVLADTPRVYYRLAEASGATATDSSGNGFNGTYVGTVTYGTTGLLTDDADTAITLTAGGSNDYITVPTTAFDPGTTGSWTIEAWIRTSTLASVQRIYVAENATNQQIEITIQTSGRLRAARRFGSSVETAVGTIATATTYHVAIVYDSGAGNILFYRNGTLHTTVSASGAGTPDAGAYTTSTIAASAGPLTGAFTGILDEVALYHAALSGARIAAHYAAGNIIHATASPAAVARTVTVPNATAGTIASPAAVARTVTVVTPAGGARAAPAAKVITVTVPVASAAAVTPLSLLNGSAGAALLPLTMAVATVPLPTPAGQSTRWQVIAVDRFGEPYAEFPTATVKTIVWTLNAPEVVTFDIPIDAPNLDQLPLARATTTPHREVQIWRNGHLLFWGPPTARQADSENRVYHYTAKGCLWYFGRRYMGKANRHNFLTNGSFESGLTGWSTVGAGITATADTGHHALGPTALKLVQTTANLDAYEVQSFIATAGAIGLVLFITAWVYLDPFIDVALNGRGVGLVRAAANVGSFASIDTNNPPVGKLTRITAGITMPPNVTEVIEARLYPPQGTMWVDAVTVTVMESISLIGANSPGGAGWDQVEIVHHVAEYLQGRGDVANAFGVPSPKSDLNIGFTADPTGIVKERTYQFFDHQRGYAGGQGSGVFDEFTKSADGFDIRVAITPATRTLTCEYPRTGTDRPDLPLTWVHHPDQPEMDVSYGISKWAWAENIEDAANEVVVLGGWGTGASREEGGYSNPPALGGLTLERIESAPNDTPIDALDTFAAQRGAQLEHSVETPIFTIVEPRDAITGEVTYLLIGVLMPGDTTPVHVDDGDVQMDGTYRLVRVELDAIAEELKVTPNPEPT